MRNFSIVAAFCFVLVSACGGSKGTIVSPGSGGTGTGGTGTGGGGTGGGTTTTLSLGSGTGGSFQSGAIDASSTSLSAGGSTSLQVSLVDQTGALYTTSSDVTFSSDCLARGLATITPATVTTTTGVASATYAANGCSPSDIVTATTTANSQSLSASVNLTVAQAAIGSIQFVSASTNPIALKGTGSTGRPETATVIFKVLDTSGGPRAQAPVTFALNSSVGRISLTTMTDTTDASGQVRTVVNAGTVATTVRVTATTTTAGGTTISTQSSALTVSTGIPTSQNISLAVQCQNVEAWDTDGDIVPVTVRMVDRFNNPVPDGTAANFRTTLGGIEGQCLTTTTTTESGVCTVNWRSQNPRSVNGVVNGRSPLLVTATGEESFKDSNGNGTFDAGDTTPFTPSTTKAWDDTQEPFLDQNEDGTWQAGEPFIDFNSNGAHDGPDNVFNGLLCTGSNCAASGNLSVAVGARNIIIMSGNTAVISPASQTFALSPNGVTAVFTITDQRNQQMPAGTKVSAELSSGAGSIVGPSEYTWPCTGAPGGKQWAFALQPPTGGGMNGTLILKVTTPKGVQTIATYPTTS